MIFPPQTLYSAYRVSLARNVIHMIGGFDRCRFFYFSSLNHGDINRGGSWILITS